ncbi:MAG: L,D-transpeptidase family protein [Candidatus Euphemobacter frigidus]|nr:L,D-transpeptidase family protein [Candidatus Euphemobacter frigidus]MDP8276153.1 L,D-transpeptidase family protein [Candidatus Euphemobacter frigidus]
MKIRMFFCLSAVILLSVGCAARRSYAPQPLPPEEPREISEEEDVVILERGEGGEEVEGIIVVEERVPAQEMEDLSWEEIQKLGTEYKVKDGDTLSGIASRYNIGTGLLARLNEIADPDLIRIGQKLIVIEGPFRITVDKSDRSLSIFLGDKFIRSYPVALGKKNSTPEGEFSVVRKLVDPPWTDPYNRTIIRADNPDYPLGTRWIEFIPPPGAYGIHGSRIAEEIGTDASFGCIRVLHPQEEEIYDFVVLGSPIVITP